MAPASHGLLGEVHQTGGPSSRYGPNGAEVEAFIRALPSLSEAQWSGVLAARRHVTSVTKESSGHEAEAIRSILVATGTGEGQLPEPMSAVARSLVDLLESRADEEVIAAWQAVSALVRRYHMPAVSFAAHYAPFATAIPPAPPEALEPAVRRYLSAIKRLRAAQCEVLARTWRLEHDASGALLRAVAKSPVRDAEQAVALAALVAIPVHLPGDAGWAAVKTAVHGGRALGCRRALSREQLTALWAPIEEAIPLAPLVGSLESRQARTRTSVKSPKKAPEPESVPAGLPSAPGDDLSRAADVAPEEGVVPDTVTAATADAELHPAAKARKPRTARTRAPRAPATYGPNSGEVAAFLKAVQELTPIQWLRVLDRRQLVASVTREGSAEPASVVRSILSAIRDTSGLDEAVRARVFAAVERAAFAVESKSRLTPEQTAQHFGPFASLIPLEGVDTASLAGRLGTLSADDWRQVAAAAAPVTSEVVGHLVTAGTALVDFLAARSDDEAVTTWHALSALTRRHQLSPIKFAVSYAPFASAIPVTSPKSLGASVERYVALVGKLSAHQCELLARPWQVADEPSSALSRAVADGGARRAEEAAALAAVVTVPMRITGDEGWAAVRTAAFGGRVVGAREHLTQEEVEALWLPLERAIPFASLDVGPKTGR